jgi:hypothetical protein
MRIDYNNYPFIDEYKSVRYITPSLVECMKKCADKFEKLVFNIGSCQVCYIYIGMFIVCDFNSVEGQVESAHIKAFKGREKWYDFIFNKGKWKEELTEQEAVLTQLSAAFTFFIENAEVEVTYLDKRSGINAFNCYYINNTNKNVKIYDSRWIRSIVMSESFNVRGHFRLQPHGEGRSKRKLIWVDEFEKQGYTRRAGKEIQEESK